MANRTGAHYDSTTIGLHWATAIVVAILWGGAQLADFVPKGAWRTNGWTLHVALGFALVTVLIWRIIWRFTGRRRFPAADANPAVHFVAEASHYALYLLLFTVVALGVGSAFSNGYSLFDMESLPRLGDEKPQDSFTPWHGFAANLLIGLALLHAAAALAHHYALKDGVLLRMFPEPHQVPQDWRDPVDL